MDNENLNILQEEINQALTTVEDMEKNINNNLLTKQDLKENFNFLYEKVQHLEELLKDEGII